MIEDPEATDSTGSSMMGAGGPSTSVGKARGVNPNQYPQVAFLIIPASQAQPPRSTAFGLFGSAVLGLFTIGSSLQLALASNITKLPKETLEFFANPDNLNSDQLPPGLENWDPTTYFDTCIPVLAAVLAVQLAHESGHRISGIIKDVKIGPSFFVPYGQVGSFGSVTPFESLVKNHKDLWDVTAAGPLAGFLVSASLLAIGLSQSHGVDVQAAASAVTAAAAASTEVTAVAASGGADLSNLVPVPSELFQGSFLLGGLTRVALGEQAMKAGAEVLVSPLVVAGWCGMLSTALNLLPCGSLDGGRLVQATFGRKTLALTSLFTYIGLGLGLLGG
jgi:membrane-associated protease RseP (regulator of RpoE activity)